MGVVVVLFGAPRVFAQTCETPRGRVVSVEGTVETLRAGQTIWMPARVGDVICVEDAVRTLEYSRAALLLADGTTERLDQNTTIAFPRPPQSDQSFLRLLIGVIHLISRDPHALRVMTPFANAGIEGTEFLVSVTEEATTVVVYEGTVRVSNTAGEVSVGSGEQASVRSGQVPVAQTLIRPRDAVQWTLYYSPIVADGLPAPGANPPPNRVNDPLFYAGRAAQRLRVGRVEEARQDIERALALDANNAEAIALQSIIAVAQNDKSSALDLANRAVEIAPNSASALLALSYAQQAYFDVSGALATLLRATQENPNDALSWSRLSELWLAVGDLDQGLRAAETAASLQPNLARTQTVLGFANLTQVNLQAATTAFEKAIALDTAAPLPRLGLGLTEIREGKLEDGRSEIEIAVILDPGNALVRSYVGKAYFEEKRDALAQSQYEIAKELDPLDPTPQLYDAILKQSVNRPIDALENLRRAIELNDYRAVYRSRLLLDEDLAVRSASLGRIYRDLGFEQAALVQGWKSVEADPSDYSGHRFLADLYSTQPRHQIARVNELFRSQLMQPLNLTPIPPQLSEINPFILNTAGPAELAFNEFNSAFNGNRVAFQGSVVAGGNETRGEDVVVSGIHNDISYSVGGLKFRTDGFRDNNDFEQDLYSAFVQFRPSYKTSLQTELRSSRIEKGDLTLLFDPANYQPNLRQSEDADSIRIGARHSFSPRSDLLGSLIYQNFDETSTQPGLSISGTLDGYSGELQHLYRGSRWHLTSGISRLAMNLDELVSVMLRLPFPPFVIDNTERTLKDVDFTSAYLYADLNTTGKATFTVGASYESLDGVAEKKNQTNPKVGVMWQATPRVTVRAAAMRTLQGPIVSRQNVLPRLEPTEVAGFNQFFFGAEGESVWRYGSGVDWAATDRLYAGIELSRRAIEFPVTVVTTVPPTTVTYDVTEKLARAYVEWALGSDWALSADYQFEDQDNHGRPSTTDLSTRLRTERLPVEIKYFHRSGFGASVRATHVHQRGNFANPSVPPPFPVTEGHDRFWVLDATISYRLPKRFGLVSVTASNMLDETFRFQDTDSENPRILPERTVLLKFTGAY